VQGAPEAMEVDVDAEAVLPATSPVQPGGGEQPERAAQAPWQPPPPEQPSAGVPEMAATSDMRLALERPVGGPTIPLEQQRAMEEPRALEQPLGEQPLLDDALQLDCLGGAGLGAGAEPGMDDAALWDFEPAGADPADDALAAHLDMPLDGQ